MRRRKVNRKTKTSTKAILLVLVSTVFTSIGQIFLKSGVTSAGNLYSILNYSLILGLVLYAFALILMLLAFKKGELSILYPILALSYIWVALLSNFLLNESLGLAKIAGVISIFIGVTLIGVGGRK